MSYDRLFGSVMIFQHVTNNLTNVCYSCVYRLHLLVIEFQDNYPLTVTTGHLNAHMINLDSGQDPEHYYKKYNLIIAPV